MGTAEGADSDPGRARGTSQKRQYLNLEDFSQESKGKWERLSKQNRQMSSALREQFTIPLAQGSSRRTLET